ncbi:hypothetical protein VOLCADRAFT_98564 [Volvox carteri f. nagariensis]|uniref:Decapping nuclease n=1 Tax=Volvox carteri f. nagariensis TaxID=3068 RepID=D8UFP2_VOLCA|nr:uncharacterized protein VOLCADRAFT_98564 [Volvox carteri f. nagariensis]EFJ41536.1 hypothetical protein VOLCADRAFT_98564 [Volvox carteri f. nagariensis]|eukprot:XP_002957481.1 hypothetical protein VOLCADRAFT_98564 [Volvox carteri f. nagariensis]
MGERAFSVRTWCVEDKLHGSHRNVSISRPNHVFCWTRSSASQGGLYSYGDPSGLRTMVPDPESLRHVNLNEGYPDAFIRKQDSDDAVPVDFILYGAKVACLPMERPTVVTFRNNLNKLLMTPLQQNDPWVIDAVWHGTTLFLEIVKMQEQRQNPDQDRFTYYGWMPLTPRCLYLNPSLASLPRGGTAHLRGSDCGLPTPQACRYKFEALCTGARPSDPVDTTGEFALMVQASAVNASRPNGNAPVALSDAKNDNANHLWILIQLAPVVYPLCVICLSSQIRLGRHLILMAAETDAWETPPEELNDPGAEFVGYVELKTYVLPQNDRAKERLYRDKYARWWVQSYLAGVPTLVAGGRDRSGILQKVERLPVTRLPALARDQGFPFDAFQLIRFGDAALDWMCATASKMPDEQVRFEYDPRHGAITAMVLDPEQGYDLPARVATALAPQPEGEDHQQIEEGVDAKAQEVDMCAE